MERPQDIKNNIAVAAIILFHLVGLAGLCVLSFHALFLQLVPYHLLLMMAVIFATHQRPDKKFFLFFLLVSFTGFCAEWIGIHTGKLFGAYTYGNTLGFKISNVPVIIGINWFMLVYCAGVFLQFTRLKSLWSRPIAGASVLVLLDVLIEPVAIRFDYWHWTNNVVPVSNYIGWFILSALMLFVFEKCRFRKQSNVGVILLAAQFMFFILLQLLM